MDLKLDIPEHVEYPVDLDLGPDGPRAGKPFTMIFNITDPKTGETVKDFEIIHEKLFHMFILSQDLSFFVHDHPEMTPDHRFRYEAELPKPGMYRVLCDFYPKGGTPQLLARTVLVPGPSGVPVLPAPVELTPNLKENHCTNLDVKLVTEPARPLAGMKTLLYFHLKPSDGLEQYLGAWAHMFASSDDLVDLIHAHPFIADGGPELQFNLIFPRPRVYRVWVQFQRKGVVNTAVFDVPVSRLE